MSMINVILSIVIGIIIGSGNIEQNTISENYIIEKAEVQDFTDFVEDYCEEGTYKDNLVVDSENIETGYLGDGLSYEAMYMMYEDEVYAYVTIYTDNKVMGEYIVNVDTEETMTCAEFERKLCQNKNLINL